MSTKLNAVVRFFRWIGLKRPYYDIHGSDGTLYMGRLWIFGGSNPKLDPDENRPVARTWKRGRIDAFIGNFVSGRLHHIAREDRARDHHTHPSSFLSIVFQGWYLERLPKTQAQHPSLDRAEYEYVLRKAGSIAFRSATDRHTIQEVSPGGCWTFVIWFKKQGSWGFWLPTGDFVNHRNYTESP
ncbi:MAG: hypothetical protein V4607_01915 [Pseudomonadota bacterium]